MEVEAPQGVFNMTREQRPDIVRRSPRGPHVGRKTPEELRRSQRSSFYEQKSVRLTEVFYETLRFHLRGSQRT